MCKLPGFGDPPDMWPRQGELIQLQAHRSRQLTHVLAWMTGNAEVERFGVKLSRNAQPVLLKNSTTSRPQGRNADYTLMWIAGPWGVLVTHLVKLPASRLRDRVERSPSGHIQSRSDGGGSPTVGRLRAVVRITY